MESSFLQHRVVNRVLRLSVSRGQLDSGDQKIKKSAGVAGHAQQKVGRQNVRSLCPTTAIVVDHFSTASVVVNLSLAPQKIPKWEPKASSRGDPEHQRSGSPLPAQDLQLRTIYIRIECQPLLREAAPHSDPPQIPGHQSAPFHGLRGHFAVY
jgi:hypothetical protein